MNFKSARDKTLKWVFGLAVGLSALALPRTAMAQIEMELEETQSELERVGRELETLDADRSGIEIAAAGMEIGEDFSELEALTSLEVFDDASIALGDGDHIQFLSEEEAKRDEPCCDFDMPVYPDHAE